VVGKAQKVRGKQRQVVEALPLFSLMKRNEFKKGKTPFFRWQLLTSFQFFNFLISNPQFKTLP
jgi:hypothetical protein